MGELYEAKGERAKAAEYYQKFVDLCLPRPSKSLVWE